MASVLVILFGIAATCNADNYRVPLPYSQAELRGYMLVVERVNIHNGDIKSAEPVSRKLYKSGADCSRAQMNRLSKPDLEGYVKVYFCHAVIAVKYPKGTEQL